MQADASLHQIIIQLGGGRYRGMFPSFRDRKGRTVEAVVLFDSPTTGTTLGLPLSRLNSVNVRQHIAKSDAECRAVLAPEQ